MRRVVLAALAMLFLTILVMAPIIDYANIHGWLPREWSEKLCFGQKECLKVIEKKTAGRQ